MRADVNSAWKTCARTVSGVAELGSGRPMSWSGKEPWAESSFWMVGFAVGWSVVSSSVRAALSFFAGAFFEDLDFLGLEGGTSDC